MSSTTPHIAAPQKNSWKPLAFALAAYMFLPELPNLQVILPIDQTWLLLIPSIAACAVVGWINGGSLLIALMWVVLAVLGAITKVASAQAWMERGWAILLAASFGFVCVFLPGRPFFTRALATLGLATLLAFGIVLSAPNGVGRVTAAVEAELSRRAVESATMLDETSNSEAWQELAKKNPVFQVMPAKTRTQLMGTPGKAAPLATALLALQSLAALALAWSLYHTLFRAPIGARLGKLRDFKFNDQLVWGIAVGATIYLLPSYDEGKVAGLNLLLFFGTLFSVRGLGILAWMAGPERKKTFIITMAVVSVFAWPLLAIVAFGIGLGDTWLDWRSRQASRVS